MTKLCKLHNSAYTQFDHLPERVIQFGEGNFLRGFIDWMIHQMNKQGIFNGRIVAIQPTPHGKVVPKLNAQDSLYTFIMRGIDKGHLIEQSEVISSISRGINPYENWEEVLKVAEKKEIEFMFSNTTEAGLTYQKESYDPSKSPLSFPGKLTAFLYHRYQVFKGSADAGLRIFPCELLEDNGELLQEVVIQVARDWGLSNSFIQWVRMSNKFCNTLVDRIVPGYPKDEIEEYQGKLGYIDKLLTVGEPYYLFAVEADPETIEAIPFHRAGLKVFWGDVQKYRELKVRILNGVHTMLFSTAYLAGKQNVLEAMRDPLLYHFVKRGLYDEILPMIDTEEKQKADFAETVVERFMNPYMKHMLTDIGMNAIHKYKTRLIPTLMKWMKCKQDLPKIIVFSLAALIAYYHPKRMEMDENVIRDNDHIILFFRDTWGVFNGVNYHEIVERVLGNTLLWGSDLSQFYQLEEKVVEYLQRIIEQGIEKTLESGTI